MNLQVYKNFVKLNFNRNRNDNIELLQEFKPILGQLQLRNFDILIIRPDVPAITTSAAELMGAEHFQRSEKNFTIN